MPASPAGWDARYSDGRTAAARTARAALEAADLVIRDEGGATLATWPAAEVRLLDGPDSAGRVRLARVGGAERLTVLAPGALEELERHCSALRKDAYGGPGWRPVVLWSLAAVAAAAFLFLVIVPFVAHRAADWVPPRLEAELGRRTADVIIQLFGRSKKADGGPAECDDARGRQALDALTAPLFAAVHLSTPPKVRVIDAAMVNAAALPGGQILVFKGLIDFTQGPNELAGVLAHELAHVELGHPTELVIERGATAFLVGLLLGDVFGGSAVVGIGQAALQARYSRAAERAADARGVAILEAAGLDPRPFGAFFKRLAGKEVSAGGIGSFLDSHPASEERAALVAGLPARGRPALDEADWQALKRICG